ncbi:MAG TPA: IclR family transcriptional regulator [Streptosporangiaceae bacterium]|jgi:IclR family acetate operon transcriptional repressor
MTADSEKIERRDPGRLSSVRNAARLLKEFSGVDKQLGVTELATRLGLGKSTVHRLLATLADERLLERDEATGRYRLGLGIYELGAVVTAHVDLHEAAMPALISLRQRTGETVQVSVLDGLEVVYVERLDSPHTLRIFSRVGHRMPANATSSGKVLLAGLPSVTLEARLRQWQPVAMTLNTITDATALRAELRLVAKRGWAENVEEGEVGVASVGAPIRGIDGSVTAAISVAGPITRVKGASLRRFSGAVVEAANGISARLGYRG